MRVAILETVKADGGFELEFDHVIIETLKEEGHEPILFLPMGTELGRDLHVPVCELEGGPIVSYDGAGRLKKIWLSLQRERRRVKWFDAMAEAVVRERADVVLLTTATYRYLRALKKSALRNSSVPVCFIFLGVNPQEMPKFLQAARSCQPYRNIHLCVTTLRDDVGVQRPDNVRLIPPPVLSLSDTMVKEEGDTLRIGFFGHYRKGEKKAAWFLRAAEEGTFTRSVHFILQAAPTRAQDQADVEALVEAYRTNSKITVLTEKLIDTAWYEAISSVDVLFLPYTAERYLYNWSALYFTAIGFHKPVITTDVLNPEIMAAFDVGECVNMDNFEAFLHGVESFVNRFSERKEHYAEQLQEAAEKYSRANFIRNLLGLRNH